MSDGFEKPVPLRQHREQTISRLCEHFAQDHIPAERLERLIDQAHAARTVSELESLLVDLPELPKVAPPATMPMEAVEAHQTVIAIMGGAERKGSWAPARMTRVFVMMAGASLDFRNVRMPAGTTEVQVLAVMGGAEIIVPPGLRVASDGVGIMGGFGHSGASSTEDLPADAPLLRVTGVALMGGVDIVERFPGESASDARRRRRQEREARKLERRRRLGEG